MDKGYQYTHMGDKFLVDIRDLQVGSGQKIKTVCDVCGKSYYLSYVNYNSNYYHITKNIDVCKACANRENKARTYKQRAEYYFGIIEDICRENNYVLLTNKSEYTSVRMNIRYICPKHGEYTTIMETMLNGSKCQYCHLESVANSTRLSQQEVTNKINSTNNCELLNPNDYTNVDTKNLIVKCGTCGKNTFVTSYNLFVHSNQQRCKQCSNVMSYGEDRIMDYLNANGIKFIHNYKIQECKDKLPLPFDFYLPDYNLLIEFDGKHHFEPIHGQERFEIAILHDKIKNQYCEENNIDLLRIHYLDTILIEEILSLKLNIDN